MGAVTPPIKQEGSSSRIKSDVSPPMSTTLAEILILKGSSSIVYVVLARTITRIHAQISRPVRQRFPSLRRAVLPPPSPSPKMAETRTSRHPERDLVTRKPGKRGGEGGLNAGRLMWLNTHFTIIRHQHSNKKLYCKEGWGTKA